MTDLKVIKEAGSGNSLCYITDQKTATEKLEEALEEYEPVSGEAAADVLREYASFAAYGAKETPSFTFTRGNDTDWFIAQVAIKHRSHEVG